MVSEMEKDEIKMSWNKKVSMREIARFYEDKLRELDAKYNNLVIQNEKLISNFSDHIKNLDQWVKTIDDNYSNIKDLVDKEERMSGEINNFISAENKMFAKFMNDTKSMVEKMINIIRDKDIENKLRERIEIDTLFDLVMVIAHQTDPSLYERLIESTMHKYTAKSDEYVMDFIATYMINVSLSGKEMELSSTGMEESIKIGRKVLKNLYNDVENYYNATKELTDKYNALHEILIKKKKERGE